MGPPPECGENPIRPIVGGHVKTAEHLRRGDGLGVHPHLPVGHPAVGHGPHEGLDALGLARPARPQHHHPVPHPLRLEELDQLEGPWRVVYEARHLHLAVDGGFEVRVPGLLELDAREEVFDKAEEEWLVLVHQLGEVHVTQHPHHDGVFAVLGTRALHRAEGAQDGEDVSESKVIVHLKVDHKC